MDSEKNAVEIEMIIRDSMPWLLSDESVRRQINDLETAPATLKKCLPLAEMGDTDAMEQIADIYARDLMPPPKDGRDQFYWYARRAEQRGIEKELLYQASRYASRIRFHQTPEKAAEQIQKVIFWLEKVEQSDDRNVMHGLGLIYEQERFQCTLQWDIDMRSSCRYAGVKPNISKAVQCYKKAAEQGNALSMLALAWLYRTSIQDSNQAFEWYQKAAATDLKNHAMLNLGEMYERGEGTQRDMAKAIECYAVAAKSDVCEILAKSDAHAMAALARIYQEGDGVPKDSAKAVEWLEKAAAANHYYAVVDLALMYAHGDGIPQDIEKASGLLKKAARCSGSLLYVIGQACLTGEAKGGDAEFEFDSLHMSWMEAYRIFPDDLANPQKALCYFTRAAAVGDSRAMIAIGNMCSKGVLFPRNFKKAYEWYELAVVTNSRDSGTAKYEIGNLYYIGGYGITQDFEKAFLWYQRAAACGEREVKLKLAAMYEKGEGVRRNKKKAEALREELEHSEYLDDIRQQAMSLFDNLSRRADLIGVCSSCWTFLRKIAY